MKRLQTINESLQLKGPMKSVYASISISAHIKEDGKVATGIHTDVDGSHASINEAIDKIKGDKLEMLQRDLRSIINDAKIKIEKMIEKYNLNQ